MSFSSACTHGPIIANPCPVTWVRSLDQRSLLVNGILSSRDLRLSILDGLHDLPDAAARHPLLADHQTPVSSGFFSDYSSRTGRSTKISAWRLSVLFQLRQLMKTHSFVRENAARCTEQSNGLSHLGWSSRTNFILDQSTAIQSSHFHRYIYFLFAPTLLYRDTYPRTPAIRWDYAAKMFVQFGVVLILVYHVIVFFWLPVFRRMLTDEVTTVESTITDIYDLMIPGVLIVILGKTSAAWCSNSHWNLFLGSFLRIFPLLVEWIRWNSSICWSNVLRSESLGRQGSRGNRSYY